MRVRRATSLERSAATSSGASMPERMLSASFGPTPATAIRRSKSACSAARQEAEERERVLAHVGVDEQLTSAPGLAERGRRCESGIATR